MSNEGLDKLIGQRKQYASEHVDVDFIKIWVDGSPTPPYFTQADVFPDSGGIELDRVLFPPDALNDAVVRFDRMGLKVKLHVAGDGSARAALDAIEMARKANPGSEVRHELGAHKPGYTCRYAQVCRTQCHCRDVAHHVACIGPPAWRSAP